MWLALFPRGRMAGLINMQTAENKSLIDQKHISYNMQQDHGGGHPGCCWSVAAWAAREYGIYIKGKYIPD